MNLGRTASVGVALVVGLMCMTVARHAGAQQAADYFGQNCASCHTIGGGSLVGPDLKDVEVRAGEAGKSRDWLIEFLLDPPAMIDSGDKYAVNLKKQAKGAVMSPPAGITKDLADALLKLIEAESKLEKSQFVGVTVEAFDSDDVKPGEEYFTGVRRFKNGAAPCLSCHAVRGTGALGGGRLGPDLTLVFERQENRKNLWNWLTKPATTTMQPLFTQRPLEQEEVRALVAFLEDSAIKGGEENMSGPLAFLLLGLGGAVVGFLLFDTVWKKRLRAVRRLLVHRPRRQGDTES